MFHDAIKPEKGRLVWEGGGSKKKQQEENCDDFLK